MSEELYELPNGWKWTNFDELISFLTDYQSNGSFSSLKQNVKYYEQENYAILVRLKDLRNNLEKTENFVYTDKDGYNFLKKTSLYGGEILVANVGTVGTTLLMPKINMLATLAPNMFLVKLQDIVSKKIFLNYCNSSLFWREIEKISGGSGQPKINKKEYRSIIIPLPPLPEQHRIVAKIEELFTELDAGVELLKKLKAKLKRYRQAVLKAAVEGNLTKEWREANQGKLEPASVLLERILKQRREKWEAEQLAKMKAQGKTPKDDSWKLKYKEPVAPDTSELPELPDGWCWVRLDAITALKGGITKDSKRKFDNFKKIPYLRVANVQRGFLDLSEIKEIEASETIIAELLLKRNDILFNEGGDRDKLGRGWIWQEEISECIHQNHVFRGRLYDSNISAKFISWCSNSYGAIYFMNEGKQTTNLASINLTKLSAFPISLPPQEEQIQIQYEVELRLSVIDQLEKTIDANLKRAEKLRQSILKQAFEGKLVPQDPNDEPAGQLLERIKAEKTKPEAEKKNKRQPKIKSSKSRKSKTTATQLELNFNE